MRELHGVMYSGQSSLELKRRALLFDKFHIWHLNDEEFVKTEEFETELDFLRAKHIIVDEPPIDNTEFAEKLFAATEDIKRFSAQLEHVHASRNALSIEEVVDGTMTLIRDNITRMVTTTIVKTDDFDLVPICELSLPDTLPCSAGLGGSRTHVMNDVASVTSRFVPAPDESCSW